MSCSAVSTSMILMPASLSCLHRRGHAPSSSVGAISIAAGLLASEPVTIGVCDAASNFCGACVSSVYPSFVASACAPHCIEM